jgi:hypothetical protein
MDTLIEFKNLAELLKGEKLTERDISILNAFNRDYYDHYYNYCQICDARLLPDDKYLIDHNRDFSIVCSKHREYATYFQIDVIREKLGYAKSRFSFVELLGREFKK